MDTEKMAVLFRVISPDCLRTKNGRVYRLGPRKLTKVYILLKKTNWRGTKIPEKKDPSLGELTWE